MGMTREDLIHAMVCEIAKSEGHDFQAGASVERSYLICLIADVSAAVDGKISANHAAFNARFAR